MNIKIVTAEQLPDQIETLATLARKEGYNLVDKLIEEYRTGKNCFSHANEYLVVAHDGKKLVACGGLNQQWGDNGIEDRIGRCTPFLCASEISSAWRRQTAFGLPGAIGTSALFSFVLANRYPTGRQFLSKAELCICGKQSKL